jgi:glycosyltransferase involved in cell wall biosynthesis
MASADLGMQLLANVPAFYYGTSPNKFFDYIASGLPVLNNYPGWLADYIQQQQCGFAVKPDNSDAFADALVQAASDRLALKQMGERAKQLAKTQFNREALADEWVNWVTGVVS